VPVGLVVNELAWNACKHAFPAGRPGLVRVSLTAEGDDYELRVEDDGIGMRDAPPEGRPSGAGMAIATRIAAQLGGGLSVEPARPSGTIIRLRFPRQ
jgi:two-component system, sensor histidine kinase PdtaS